VGEYTQHLWSDAYYYCRYSCSKACTSSSKENRPPSDTFWTRRSDCGGLGQGIAFTSGRREYVTFMSVYESYNRNDDMRTTIATLDIGLDGVRVTKSTTPRTSFPNNEKTTGATLLARPVCALWTTSRRLPKESSTSSTDWKSYHPDSELGRRQLLPSFRARILTLGSKKFEYSQRDIREPNDAAPTTVHRYQDRKAVVVVG